MCIWHRSLAENKFFFKKNPKKISWLRRELENSWLVQGGKMSPKPLRLSWLAGLEQKHPKKLPTVGFFLEKK